MPWDVFISHASEDKTTVVRPLARMLRHAGIGVWLDESELKIGDSLRSKIDDGLAQSRFGVVILSASFFAKDWPQRELGALFARRDALLPVWHGLSSTEVAKRSPLLADIVAASTSEGLPAVASKIIAVVRGIRQADKTCQCPVEYQQLYAEIVGTTPQLPEAIARYVAHIAEVLRAAGGDVDTCCTFRGTARRCADTLLRSASFLTAATAAFDEKKAADTEQSVLLYDRVRVYRSSIADWCTYVERVVEQRRKPFLLEQLALDLGTTVEGHPGWVLSVIEDVVNEYGRAVLMLNGPPSFVLLVDPQEQVLSHHAEALLLVPTTSFADVTGLIIDLWHQIGQHAFFLRYDFTQFEASEIPRRAHLVKDDLETFWHDVAAIYSDIALLAYAFHHDIRAMAIATAQALINSAAFRESAPPKRDRYLLHLLFRLYFPAQFVMLAKATADGEESERRLLNADVATVTAIVASLAELLQRAVLSSVGIELPVSSTAVTTRNVMSATGIEMRRIVYQLRSIVPHATAPQQEPVMSDLETQELQLDPAAAIAVIAHIAGISSDRPDTDDSRIVRNRRTLRILRATRFHATVADDVGVPGGA